ncbi:hypothetical protein I4641_19760 [Waterburya agarophytonicola K14]|uniref:DUF5648 domain-containing protein n=1 Tax=Waterburya agarophytonicola KI4 TaxID=2874699 RepID=A0A964FL73_9CYAN|nr:hypothetical protein [Waterburya agarophytonicola]MCC0179203.1 hypothetical protein [Waterburya agarophytonicola KI4]
MLRYLDIVDGVDKSEENNSTNIINDVDKPEKDNSTNIVNDVDKPEEDNSTNIINDVDKPESEDISGVGDLVNRFEIDSVHRFFESNNGFHFYTVDDNESDYIREQTAAGNLAYQYESEKFTVLTDNIDALTGEVIEGVQPVYRFFNRQTGSHLYTMNQLEKETIQDTLEHYSFEGIKYYAFESQPENLETIPVYRMLNSSTGSHLFSSDRNEIENIQATLPDFSLENNGNPTFYVFEL